MRKRLATPAQAMLLAAATTATAPAEPPVHDMRPRSPAPSRLSRRPWWSQPTAGDWARISSAQERRARRAQHRLTCAKATEQGQARRAEWLRRIVGLPPYEQKVQMIICGLR